MPETSVNFSAAEREVLASLLKIALKDARVEEHRTRAPGYRDFILEKEMIIAEILRKLGEKVE